MTTYTKNVFEPWFSLIKIGKKKVEGRLNKSDFNKMKRGDIIVFNNNELGFDRSFKVVVKYITKYQNFKDYLEAEHLYRCLPGIDTIDQGLNVYYKYYSKNDEESNGIVAITMKTFIK